MCDTFVALPNATSKGDVIFAKNSDRDPNEAQQLVIIPEAEHGNNDTVQCTYVEIPQVPKTNRVLLAKPFWIWGAEMGVNEYGVAIGNEAIFTKEKSNRLPGLTGMDFLRLGLERSTSAYQALEVITALLEKCGQGGNCGYSHPFYYMNSFILADRSEAWVLETIDRYWAAVKVNDVYFISNAYTIQEEWDLASSGLIPYARERGWLKKGEDFHFKKCFSDILFTAFSDADKRRSFTFNQLEREKGSITAQTAMEILRGHRKSVMNGWRPDLAIAGQDVCMHAGFGPIRINQTVGSLVSVLNDRGDQHWATGTSAPCISIFKPVWLEAGIPEFGLHPASRYDQSHLWWRHEALHRSLFMQYPAEIQNFMEGCRSIEEKNISETTNANGLTVEQKRELSQQCFSVSEEYDDEWRVKFEKMEPQRVMPFYNWYWKQLNNQVNL